MEWRHCCRVGGERHQFGPLEGDSDSVSCLVTNAGHTTVWTLLGSLGGAGESQEGQRKLLFSLLDAPRTCLPILPAPWHVAS